MDLAPLIPIAVSIAGAVGGAFYARKRGLPDLKAEVETQTAALVKALKEQLTLANTELSLLRPKLTAAEARILALESEIERLERRIVVAYIRIAELEKKQ